MGPGAARPGATGDCRQWPPVAGADWARPERHTMGDPERSLMVVDMGLKDYREVWQFQTDSIREVATGSSDLMILVEHPPVITRGRGSHDANILRADVPVVEIERGGDVTWHGPGQLVAYPLLRLDGTERDLHRHLRNCEELTLRVLASFGVEGRRRDGLTGVWVGDEKLASIGIAVRQWVTFHGIALNVNNDPAEFARIRPCGLDPAVMTSLARLLGTPVPLALVGDKFGEHAPEVFGRRGHGGVYRSRVAMRPGATPPSEI